MAARKKAVRRRIIHTEEIYEDNLTGKIEDVISYLEDLKTSMEGKRRTNITINVEATLDSEYGYGGTHVPCARLEATVSYKFK